MRAFGETGEREHHDVEIKMPIRLSRPHAGAVLLATTFGSRNAEAATPAALEPLNTWQAVTELVATTYDRAPALVLGLAVLFALPPLALLGAALRRGAPVVENTDATRVYRRGGRGRLKEIDLEADDTPLWPSSAWVELAGGQRHDIGSSILRIGRDADNDICLEDKTVHRYHAAIHRTDDAAFVITDLSSADGNGILVNGLRVHEIPLNDGDRIELGQTKLTFASRPT